MMQRTPPGTDRPHRYMRERRSGLCTFHIGYKGYCDREAAGAPRAVGRMCDEHLGAECHREGCQQHASRLCAISGCDVTCCPEHAHHVTDDHADAQVGPAGWKAGL